MLLPGAIPERTIDLIHKVLDSYTLASPSENPPEMQTLFRMVGVDGGESLSLPEKEFVAGLAEKLIRTFSQLLGHNMLAATRAANRAFAIQQHRVSIPRDLAAAYVALAKLAQLISLLALVGLKPTGLIDRLGLTVLTGILQDSFELHPPPPKPLKVIPQAKPNAPAFA